MAAPWACRKGREGEKAIKTPNPTSRNKNKFNLVRKFVTHEGYKRIPPDFQSPLADFFDLSLLSNFLYPKKGKAY
jgi:hypothetical protein